MACSTKFPVNMAAILTPDPQEENEWLVIENSEIKIKMCPSLQVDALYYSGYEMMI